MNIEQRNHSHKNTNAAKENPPGEFIASAGTLSRIDGCNYREFPFPGAKAGPQKYERQRSQKT